MESPVPKVPTRYLSTGVFAWAAIGGAGLLVTALATPVPTTLNDFFIRGTQPLTLLDPIVPAEQSCFVCHGGYANGEQGPYDRWRASMMAQAARDPMFHACLAIANQDAAESGDLCIRCHAPRAWLEGRSVPSDGSAIELEDFEGVTCEVCHRMVDPVYSPGNPVEDVQILADLGQVAASPHTGSFNIDPLDRRRGPFNLGPGFAYHEWRQSPFHRESLLCSTCHDVSNPVFERVGGPIPAPSDTYVPGALDAAHPDQDKYNMFPVERTYSEWANSAFAAGPIEMGGRFGGNLTAVSSCQDCHMPDVTGRGCLPGLGSPVRTDLPQHNFAGANTWVLDAILQLDVSGALYEMFEGSGLTQEDVDAAKARNFAMLRAASDMELSLVGDKLNVRIVNQSGHKLPTGYPEGRRMWINVQFYDASDALVAERGAYDTQTAVLNTVDTKVIEAKLGLDATMAAITGLPAGESFHFVLNNMYVKDNRIPPRGFTNAAFAAVQAAPVGATFADGQYWDDTQYDIPCNAVRAKVVLYYQTTSKEYIEFLRDENQAPSPNVGDIAYALWEVNGKSAPVDMDLQNIVVADCNNNGIFDGCDLQSGVLHDVNEDGYPDECVVRGDANCDGNVDFFDIDPFLLALFDPVGYQAAFPGCPLANSDCNSDNNVDFFDIDAFLQCLFSVCP